MIYPGTYETEMKAHEEDGNLENAIKDTLAVLKQEGYEAGANVLERMLKNDKTNA